MGVTSLVTGLYNFLYADTNSEKLKGVSMILVWVLSNGFGLLVHGTLKYAVS